MDTSELNAGGGGGLGGVTNILPKMLFKHFTFLYILIGKAYVDIIFFM